MTRASHRSVILLSPQFPPCPLAAVHRARHLAKHLPDHGWRPIVIRAADNAYVERLDHGLADLVPASVEQVTTSALDARLARKLGIGDIGLRGYFQFARAIDRVVDIQRPSAVFITAAPYYPLLLARRIKQRHGLPVVLDFQDPWVSTQGASERAWSKAWLAHRLGVLLEPKAIAHADFITSVSERQNQEMAVRHPWFDPSAMAAIPIGGDPDDFAAIDSSVGRARGSTIDLSYVGAYWPRAEPCLRQLFRGAARLRERSPEIATRIRLRFVGTSSSNKPGETLATPVADIAAAEGVGEMVVESPQRVPFTEALQIMSQADGLLVIGSDEPHYTASKIYPVLMTGRPYLSLYHADSSATAILRRAGGGRVLGYHPAALDRLADDVADGLFDLATRPQLLGSVDPSAYAPFTAHAIAGQFAAIFERVCGQPRR